MARYYQGLCLRRVEEYRDDRSSNESGEVRDQSRAMRRESSTGDGRAPAGLLSGACSLLWRAGNRFPANHRKTEVRVAGGRKIAGPRVSIRSTAGRATQSASRRWPSKSLVAKGSSGLDQVRIIPNNGLSRLHLACPKSADSVAKVFLRHGTEILRAVGATIE